MSIHNQSTPDSLERAVLSAMREETSRIVEEEAQAAAVRVKERVRGIVGQIATKIATFTSFERRRDELLITVKITQ